MDRTKKRINTRRAQRINYLKTKLGFFKNASWEGVKVIFIVSTGRTGTRFLARFFRLFSLAIDSRHEPDPDFLKLGVNYAKGLVSAEVAAKIIKERRLWICDSMRKNNKNIYIESNNRYFSLIPILWQIFPDAKVIHIVRDGRDVVRSTMNRDFYTPRDGIYFRKKLRLQASDFANDPYYDQWKTMTQFQKACWHWVKKDSFIRQAVKDDHRAMRVKFEDIFNRESSYQGLWEMINFMDIGVDRESFQKQCELSMDKKLNISKKEEFPRWQNWSPEQKKQFMNIAGEYMNLYGYKMSDFI